MKTMLPTTVTIGSVKEETIFITAENEKLVHEKLDTIINFSRATGCRHFTVADDRVVGKCYSRRDK